MDPFWGLEITRIHTGTGCMDISLHPRYVRICANILPQNGTHFGVVQMDTGSVSGSLKWDEMRGVNLGRNVLVEGVFYL